MIPKIIEAKYKRDYIIRVRFLDGTEGDIDLRDELYGLIFEPLQDLDVFKQGFVHPDFHTICWPNGADLAPEFVYDHIRRAA